MHGPVSKIRGAFAVLCTVVLLMKNAVHSTPAAIVEDGDDDDILCKLSLLEVDEESSRTKTFVCDIIRAPRKRTVPSVAQFDPSSNPLKGTKESLFKNDWYITFPSCWLTTTDHRPTPVIKIPSNEKVTRVDPVTVQWLEQKGSEKIKHNTNSERQLRKTKPQESVLIVRIKSSDRDYAVGVSEAKREVFGIGAAAGQVTAHSQFSACSFGEMELVPYVEDGVDGTIDVELPNRSSSYDKYTLRTEARILVCAQLGYVEPVCTIPVDHLMFISPGGVSGASSIFAYGAPGGTYTVYQGGAFETSYILHELGHNLWLAHAMEFGQGEYGDDTGMMGSSERNGSGKRRCFNGWNMWTMGWLTDRR